MSERIVRPAPVSLSVATYPVLLVADGKIIKIEIPQRDDADYIHALIGNYFTSCFTVRSRAGVIVGYCADVLHGKEKWNVVPEPGVLRANTEPIAGPIVICGVATTGEGRGLTEVERDSFYVDHKRTLQIVSGVPGHFTRLTLPLLAFRDQTQSHLNALDNLPL